MAGKKKRTVRPGVGSFEDLPEEVKAFVHALTFGASMESGYEKGPPHADRSPIASRNPTKTRGGKKRKRDK
jgi:hypothetical protein